MIRFIHVLPVFMICMTVTVLAQSDLENKLAELETKAEQYLDEQNYEQAIETYQNVMSQPAFESAPSFRYLEIAKAYFLNADIDQAKNHLEKARVAIHLRTGIYRCKESADSPEYMIINVDQEKQNSPAVNEVSNLVCNYFTQDNYFYPHTLEEFKLLTRRIEAFEQLEALIVNDSS